MIGLYKITICQGKCLHALRQETLTLTQIQYNKDSYK